MTDTVPEVVCIGETMVMLVPDDALPITAQSRMAVRVGGAESNVARSLAGLGHSTSWLSAVGDDPFGRIILDDLASAGVDVAEVTVDSDAPTGIYAKDPRGASTRVHYYRRGSAASKMSPSHVSSGIGRSTKVVHVSGTTAALSDSCRELARAIVERRVLGNAVVSFDVNYRPGLWPVDAAAEELAALARRADIVFVGRDEAETLWGTRTAEDVREMLPEPSVVVVKDGAREAVAFHSGGVARVPAMCVEVVEPVGAGDAFAAG